MTVFKKLKKKIRRKIKQYKKAKNAPVKVSKATVTIDVTTNKSTSVSVQKKKPSAASEKNVIASQKRIQSVMEKTGWTHEQATMTMNEAKKRLGISFADYDKNDFFNVPEAEQEEKYAAILAKKERRRKHLEEKQEHAIEGVMAITGWEHDETEAKIIEAQKRTGCTYKEYLIYRFYDLTPEQQDKVFVAKFSRKITAKYDVNKEFADMLYDKEATNNYFAEYLKRPWCVNTKVSEQEFAERFADSKRVIYKPLDGNRGKGVKAFDINVENAAEVYAEVSQYPAGVVEQYVVQHPAISAICPSSVNTIRVVTISSNTQPVMADGRMMDVAYASLRIGGGGSIVDNFHSGGMVSNIDLDTGVLITDAADMAGNVFVNHPATGTKIKGLKIPFFAEAMEMVKEAIEKNRIEGYLGWDIAITEDGPVLIEVNVIPGVVLLSMPYAAEKKGMKYVMEKYM